MSEAVMMALAEKIGRAEAHRMVQDAARNALATKRPLAAALKEDAVVRRHFDDTALTRLLDPAHYVGEAKDVVDRVLARAAKY